MLSFSEMRGLRSHRKFTPTTIVQIPRWLDEGLSADQIAARIGCTVGTLRVKCSKLGISLRRRDYDRAHENVNGTRRARKRSSEPREGPPAPRVLIVH